MATLKVVLVPGHSKLIETRFMNLILVPTSLLTHFKRQFFVIVTPSVKTFTKHFAECSPVMIVAKFPCYHAGTSNCFFLLPQRCWIYRCSEFLQLLLYQSSIIFRIHLLDIVNSVTSYFLPFLSWGYSLDLFHFVYNHSWTPKLHCRSQL